MMAAILTICGTALTTEAGAQTAETFTVATLNVDGLPTKILVVNSNPNGPGSAGSVRIGKYLVQKGYDLVFMQEDFNYHEELTIPMEDDYLFDEWSGNVDIDGHDIDFMHLQNHRFACDGLMGAWKQGTTLLNMERTVWKDGFGKFSHALDEMVTKGFRRYEVRLPSGTEIVVYNMHMDAEDDADTQEGKALPDRQAREGQWQQLRDDILNRLDTRPVIVVGDLNSLYCRDRVKELFVDAIAASGKAIVTDCWIALEHKGQYPEYQENSRIRDDDENLLSGETLDKILCVNPVRGRQLRPIAYRCDRAGFLRNGTPLGDHYPVSVTFEVAGSTGIEEVSGVTPQTGSYYDLQGRSIKQPAKGLYIERRKNQTRKVVH